ncbi:MAG: TonB-dependent receptor [Candidatus Glassbacteria bacterium]|nr:TonB-dependent receptor [Candidatus Glassbacteria bacterium]
MQQKSFITSMSALMALLTLLVVSAFAQITTGKVEGVVRDSDTGQPLQGAQVVIEGTRLGNVTNVDGYYFILNVPPGRRDVTFTYTGYQKTTVAGQLVLAGQTLTVDVGVSSTVVQLEGITVEGEADVLMPRDNTVTKQRLTSERIQEIPAERIEDMMILEAGVEIGGRDAMGRGLRIRGGRMGEEAMVVDGVMVRNFTADPFRQGQGWIFDEEVGSRSEDTTPLEFSSAAVEQVDIITGGFQAEYGNAQSGIINIITKEGGPQLRGAVRWSTDEVMQRTADWGYNQVTGDIGGPVPGIPNVYFHASGELQGQADRSYTHADEGFRAIDQTFVDRLNDAVRNDPTVIASGVAPFTLEKLQIGREFFGTQTGTNQSLFTAPHPVRLPGNWGDRTLGTVKLTASPISTLKLLGSLNRSRNQYSYPQGWTGSGNYFEDGLFYKGDPDWASRDWGSDTVVYVPQSYARKTRSTNLLLGADWDVWRSAERTAAVQLRFTNFRSVENNNSSLKNNYDRPSFLGWNMHDIPFEFERFPNREGPPSAAWWPDGAVGWKSDARSLGPYEIQSYGAYYLNYYYLREKQNNYKADLDFQWDRYNRAKLGFQFTTFENLSFRSDYRTTIRDPFNEFRYKPQMYSGYLQNRTDLGDFVFDYGLRYDGFTPRANWGITTLDAVAERTHPKTITEWSPRFDVGFPVTDKAQFRFSYGVFAQLPQFNLLFSRGRNPGGLEYQRTDSFESGLSYLLTDDMVFDLVAYYRDIQGNVARKQVFIDEYLWHSGYQVRGWSNVYTNRDVGNIKGIDFTMRKRFSDNFSFNLNYTMQFSRTTGSAYNTPSLSGNLDVATGESYIPPDELRPIDGDQTHKFSYQFNYLFPEDFQQGTLANTILKDLRAYAVFNMISGEPMLDWGGGLWTRSDNPGLTRDNQGRRIGGLNYFRNKWYYNIDLRFTKRFPLGAARYLSVFTEIYNVTSRKDVSPYPSGYQLDSQVFNTVTDGVDVVWADEYARDPNLLSNKMLLRFNADFNGDGILTVEEAGLGEVASRVAGSTMDKRRWGRARRIRLGVNFSF